MSVFVLASSMQLFWKLDNWEDDSRRRRRLIRNPSGTRHADAVLVHKPPVGDTNTSDDADLLNNEFNRQLHGHKLVKANNQNQLNDADADHMMQIDDKDMEQELTGPIHYTTKCKLVCAVCTVNGTLSITANEIYFEVDEDDEAYKGLNDKVGIPACLCCCPSCLNCHVNCSSCSFNRMSSICTANGISARYVQSSCVVIYCKPLLSSYSLPIEVSQYCRKQNEL